MKLLKISQSLPSIDIKTLSLTESFGMTISSYLDSVLYSSSELPFSISVSNKQIPFILEEEYALSVRNKVDLSATGPDVVTLTEEGKDTGSHNYKDRSPYRPRVLTEGFIEIKK